MTESSTNTVGGRRLVRNALWNLAGFLVPVGVALVTIPWLLQMLGTERFGLLSLSWVVLGYFGLFDLGLGRALTQLVSTRLGSERERDLPGVVWTALLLMATLGLAGGCALYWAASGPAVGLLNVPSELAAETIVAFQLVAFGVPAVVVTSGLRGVLEAYQRFDLVNVVRLFNGTFTFLAPLIAIQWGVTLPHAAVSLLVVRLIVALAYAVFCLREVPGLRTEIGLRPDSIPDMARLGGWMTVSNTVGPLMDYMDRFLIAALTTLTAVAYYATPFELVTRLLLIAGAVASVLYPAFAAAVGTSKDTCGRLYRLGVKYNFILIFPVVLVIVAFAPEGLQGWLGAPFRENSTAVLQWLAVGVLVNSLSQVPYVLIQGAGRPDLTAKLHLIELPVYAIGIWWAVGQFGIAGAALVWTLRVVMDAVLLFVIAERFVPKTVRITPSTLAVAAASMTVLAVVAQPMALGSRLAIVGVSLLVFLALTWTVGFNRRERQVLLQSLRSSGAPS